MIYGVVTFYIGTTSNDIFRKNSRQLFQRFLLEQNDSINIRQILLKNQIMSKYVAYLSFASSYVDKKLFNWFGFMQKAFWLLWKLFVSINLVLQSISAILNNKKDTGTKCTCNKRQWILDNSRSLHSSWS